MNENIILSVSNEELTKEKLGKINLELEEHKKRIRHSSLF